MNDVIKCPSCGRELHEKAQYCMYCMTTLYPKEDITPEISAKGRGGRIGVVILTVVLLLGFMVCAFLGIQQLSGSGDSAQKNGAGDTEKTLLGTEVESTNDTQETTQQTSIADETNCPVESIQSVVSEDEQGNIQQPVNTDQSDSATSIPQTVPASKPGNNISTEPLKPTESTHVQSCNHDYTAATCIAPMSCTICGDTVGTVNTSAHIWKPITAVIHHEEVGHYEIVEEYYKKTIYLCFFDGYNQEGFETLEELRNHMPVHSNKIDYNYVISVPDMLANTREVWATRPVEQWVVDQEAYDETIVTGYICTVCNAKKDP